MYRATLFALVFFKLIGLATCSYVGAKEKRDRQRRRVSFVYSKSGTVYNISIGCLIIASNYITIPALYSNEYPHKTVIMTIIEIVRGLLGSLIVFIIWLSYCWNQSTFVKLGNRLIDTSNELRQLGVPVHCKRIGFILLLVLLLELFFIVITLITSHVGLQVEPVTWLASVLPNVIVSWLFVQYFFVIDVTYAVLISLNEIIRNVCGNRTELVDVDRLYRSRGVFINNARIQSILQVRSIHGHLSDICAEVSRFYALPVLAGTTLIFYTILYNVFYLSQALMVPNIILDSVIILNIVCTVAFTGWPFYLLTTKVTKIMDEIDETGSVVHALLNYTMESEVRTELKLFSLQLLHRKIKFTTDGYFPLDNTLFQSVFSTMVTYLVILIQFQVGSPSGTDDH